MPSRLGSSHLVVLGALQLEEFVTTRLTLTSGFFFHEDGSEPDAVQRLMNSVLEPLGNLLGLLEEDMHFQTMKHHGKCALAALLAVVVSQRSMTTS